MSQIFVTSDLHFGHRNIALKRGFDAVEQHDEFIIKMWNETVKKKDVVYILGDITMETKTFYLYLDRLNGVKKVVGGNHDLGKHVKELLKHINSFSGMIKLRRGVILTHFPIHPNQLRRFEINIHGHVHEKTLKDYRYRNVSLENIDFKPKLLNEVIEEFKKEKKKPINVFKRMLIKFRLIN